MVIMYWYFRTYNGPKNVPDFMLGHYFFKDFQEIILIIRRNRILDPLFLLRKCQEIAKSWSMSHFID